MPRARRSPGVRCPPTKSAACSIRRKRPTRCRRARPMAACVDLPRRSSADIFPGISGICRSQTAQRQCRNHRRQRLGAARHREFPRHGTFSLCPSGILGAEPHTEVKEYDVEISDEHDEIVATRCRFFQPMPRSLRPAAATSSMSIACRTLFARYFTKPAGRRNRLDVIAIFAQPVDQEHMRAHLMLCVVDDHSEDTAIRRFQQTIFGQDKPILENQFPNACRLIRGRRPRSGPTNHRRVSALAVPEGRDLWRHSGRGLIVRDADGRNFLVSDRRGADLPYRHVFHGQLLGREFAVWRADDD